MSTNGLRTTEDSIVKYGVGNGTLLVPRGNPLLNAFGFYYKFQENF